MSATATRMARCPSCKREVQSDPALPFFEDRSAGTQDDTCRHCRYYRVAHEYDPRRANPEPPPQCRHEFEPLIEGYDVDLYYCGCAGWD